MRAREMRTGTVASSLVMIFAYNGYNLREWADVAADKARAPILIST